MSKKDDLIQKAIDNGTYSEREEGGLAYNKGITVKVWKKDEQIDLSSKPNIARLIPTEFHIKPDGDIHNRPSLAIVLEDGFGLNVSVVGEISYEMLKPVIRELDRIEAEQKGNVC